MDHPACTIQLPAQLAVDPTDAPEAPSQMPAAAAMLRVHDLRRTFDEGEIQSLRGVNLTVARGEFVSITGPSGCGKSTLLNILGALDNGYQGEVFVNGMNLQTIPRLEAFRSTEIGLIFQSFHLLPTLTALENVQIPMFGRPGTAAERKERARELLIAMGLEARIHHQPSRMSGGERQRVAIARSLANEPPLILADEPTGNLDSANAGKIMDVLQELHRQKGLTIVMVTHDANAAARAGRCLSMLDGQIRSETISPARPQ
jgi:ABC-type lipoprotein export system ATPase subunit